MALPPGALPQNRSGDQVRATVQTPADPGVRTPRAARAGLPAVGTVRSATTIRRVGMAGTSPGVRSVYVALVAPAGTSPDPELTPAKAVETVRRASDYWASQTRGRVTFKVVATKGWWRSSYGCTNVFALWDEAQARIPDSEGSHRHLLMVVPREVLQDPGCHYGFASVGAPYSGGSVYVSDLNQSLVAHELGHNLGLHHANSLICPTVQDSVFTARVGWAKDCQDRPYDDLFDVMGYSGQGFGEGNLNGPHLDVMGLNPGAVRLVGPGTTTAVMAPLSTATNGRVLRIPDPAGPVYYLEYRTATGRDVYPLRSPDRPSAGVRVIRADPHYRYATGSYELDASPSRAHDYQRNLAVGATFRSASGLVRVTVTGQSASGAVVVVRVAGPIGQATTRAVPAAVRMTVPKRTGSGSVLTARASVVTAKGEAVAGWPVRLQRLAGRTWRTVATSTTSSRGIASATARQAVTTSYRWVTDPAGRTRAVTSAIATVTAVASVRMAAVPATVARGRVLTVTGVVFAGPRPVLDLQTATARGGPWRTVAPARVSASAGASTSVSASLRVSRAGVLWTRLVVRPGLGYLGAVSAAQQTRVR